MPQCPKIVVVGSLNVDHTFRVPRIPSPGETLTATGAFTCYGGKGANQALAAARAGGSVTLIGCVGEDDYGSRYLEYLAAQGIDTSGIFRSPTPTGSAFIVVDQQGENSIVVNPGANHQLRPHHIDSRAELIRQADALLLQLECPLDTVIRAAEIAKEAGVRVFLNPSPMTEAFIHSGLKVHTLIVNQHEAAQLTGSTSEMLVITNGAGPTRLITGNETLTLPPPSVTPVDTVGAGDSFAGALTVALSEGQSLENALEFANSAGALATQKPGAQAAIPLRQEILAMLEMQAH